MKINIAYFSQFGNGKKLAGELGEFLKGKGQEVEIFAVRESKPGDMPEADFYVFSSSVRVGVLPGKMKRFLRRFKPPRNKQKYTLMTTYADPKLLALVKMEKLLKQKGMEKVIDSFSVEITNINGPLKDGYTSRLEAFADDLIKTSGQQGVDGANQPINS